MSAQMVSGQVQMSRTDEVERLIFFRGGLRDVVAIGVDAIQWKQGHQHLTLAYRIDDRCRRLLWVGTERTEKTLQRFVEFMGRLY